MTDVSVVGLGASGMAAAHLALDEGGTVYVSDTRTDAGARADADELRDRGAHVELGAHDAGRISRSGVVVVSPGIGPEAPVLRDLQDRAVQWISEPEFAFRFFDGPLIAVTGTNGKTTTTLLAGHLMEAGGIDVAVGGNVGGGLAPPASELARRDPPPAWYVLELSSFQLAGVETLRADVGVVTNLAPDHLDRYRSLEDYYADKARLFDNADTESKWVLNADDPDVVGLAGDTPGTRFWFSLREELEGAFLRSGSLVLRFGDDQHELLARSELSLLGDHNVANALAATVAAGLAGCDADSLGGGLQSATPLPHRLEPVADRGGILWVNDSKATNVAACASAVRSLTRPLLVLLGGTDKGEDFRTLATALAGRARHVVTYGAAGPRIARELRDTVALTQVDGPFEDVVGEARRRARNGEIVLLSPACASFDMFDNYERRGERFTALANEIQ